ncbi:hypothetical protein MNBD_PLANCTO03-1132 [hydrothermal vent metagenome]|uniref:Dockerin domain-containing protein n=1 Tax=hydrothermal vent metagenome TaxID=652676 RepID=A0A3B1DQ73_9ZZZZ
MNITFDGPYPEGTKISVKFSEKQRTKNHNGDKVDQHFDLCFATPMDADGVLTAQVAVGPAQMSYEVVHFGSSELMELFMPYESWPVPCVGVVLPEEFEGRYWIDPAGQEEHYYRISFDPGLLPGETVELGVLLEKPIELLEQEFDFPIFGTFAGCIADFNGDGVVDTLDLLAFLNAWTAGSPEADVNDDGEINTLDVLAFLNAWNLGCG